MTHSHQNRWVNYGLVAAIVLALAGLIYVISQQFEKVKTTVNMGYTLEAIQNPYLAAQQYLKQKTVSSKLDVDIASVWDKLEQKDALLLLNTRLIPEAYHERLLDWVAGGGHLIVTAQNYWSEDFQESGDPFLDRLGVEMYDVIEEHAETIGQSAGEALQELVDGVDDAKDTDEAENSSTPAQCDSYGYSKLTLVDYGEQQRKLQIQFGGFAHLFDSSGKALTPDIYYPNQILQYTLGQGMVTTLTSHDMWSNTNIGWYDHAYFLWLLVNSANNVWFIFDRDSDSLFSLITKHLLEPLLAGLLLLALYLWHRAKRFGPVKPEPKLARRSLKEHLLASSRFNWRHQQIYPMVKKQREDIRHHFVLRHGNHHQEDYIISTLSRSSDLTPEEVRWALTVETPEREQEFTRLIRLLQRLRNAV